MALLSKFLYGFGENNTQISQENTALQANLCYFFKNWFKKLKWPNLLKRLGIIIKQNYWSAYPSEPIQKAHFNMRHPVHTCLSIYFFPKMVETTSFLYKKKINSCLIHLQVKKKWLCPFKFGHVQYFLNVFKFFWPCSNMRIYKVKYYFWPWFLLIICFGGGQEVKIFFSPPKTNYQA